MKQEFDDFWFLFKRKVRNFFNTNALVYISGKMSGLPDHGVALFDAAEVNLQRLGYRTINPANNDGRSRNKSWAYYMIYDIQSVAKCNAVIVLDNWLDSPGARLEVAVAERLEKPIYTLESVLKEGLRFPIKPIVTIDVKMPKPRKPRKKNVKKDHE